MSKIDIQGAPRRTGCGYPAPFDEPCLGRVRRRLGDAGGLTDFGVNLLELPPGAWSSQRHWHSAEDEFVWVLEGEVVLIDDSGEHLMHAGDCAAFPKGDRNGHHFANRSKALVVCLEVGSRNPEEDDCDYSDIDLHIGPGRSAGYTHKDGTPYPPRG
ncbi:MAG TPA: cupin domain-containing protein [Rhodanobacteraceae bacterium]|nr:cupin domain-containing protein [Rhodanobacteraceae bacterium]